MKFRLVLLVALLALSSQVLSASFTVTDIRLEGLQRVSATPVFAALDINVGDEVDSTIIRQNIQSVFSTGFFANVQMARDDGILIVILQERPAIKTIVTDGNKAIPTEQLQEIMRDNDLAEGEIFQEHRLQGLARELERSYISQSRYDASVDIDIEDLENNMVSVSVNIDEGKSAKIRHINFVGNKAYTNKELRGVFELRTASLKTFFSGNKKYAKEKLTGDIERLESFYLDRGYLDFNVVSTQVSISRDKRSVYITLNLDEGEIYKVSAVDIAGDPVLPEDTVRRLILLTEGDTYSQARLDGTSEYIKTLLGNAGYTNAEVKGLTQKNQADNTVDLSFFIDPGKRVYARRIEFRGNTRTTDEVLRREMRQMESAPASNARIQQSKVRLERLPYIKQVDVETAPVAGSDDQIDVVYSIEEQPSGTLTASLGYAEFSGLNVGFNVQQSNWMGTGKQVGIGVSRSQFLSSYSFNYTDPYFTPDGVSRGFSLFYRNLDTDRIGTVRFDTDTFGGQVQFGYPISEIARLGFSFGLENQSITTGSQVPKEIRTSPLLLDNSELVYISQSDYELSRILGTGQPFAFSAAPVDNTMIVAGEPGFIDRFGNDFNNATLDLSWSRFTLNRGILATRGSSQTLRFEATLPGSDVEYFKINYDAQAFRPLTKDLTLRFRTTLGYGDGYGELDELPFFENFYAGGFGSVRGFEQSTLGPKGSPTESYFTTPYINQDLNGDGVVSFGTEQRSAYVLCDDTGDTGVFSTCEPGKLATVESNFRDRRANAFGGNVLVEFGTELILPIPFAKDSRSMQLVAFVDAGNVFSTSCRSAQENCSTLDLAKLSSAYGLGFSWLSAMGPLTFSISRPIEQSEFDRREAFQFTFGGGF